MKCRDLMTKDPIVCTPKHDCASVARLLCDSDCGSLPVVENEDELRVVGIITDRDICCRVASTDRPATDVQVGDVMSTDVVCCRLDDDVEEALKKMEDCQVRRIPILDDDDRCCGILTQADVALAHDAHVSELVEAISKPTSIASDASAKRQAARTQRAA